MKLLALATFALTSLTTAAGPNIPFTLGANFNEGLDDAKVAYLDAARVEWIRGFLPATEFVGGPRKLATDPRLQVFREAAKSGRHVALTLKWDFKSTETRVPEPDSDREKAYFDWALDVVKHGHPDILLLVNEVFVDTMEVDMKPGPDGVIPMVGFLQRLAKHVHQANPTTSDGKTPLPLSCGGFTKIDTKVKQSAPATKAMLPWLAGSPDLAFVNFHIHGDDLENFTKALEFMRKNIPEKPFIITEFSLIWRYRKNLQDKLDSNSAGKSFVKQYQLDPNTTVLDYVNQCTRKQVPEKEFNDFLRSRSWYIPTFLDDSTALMRKYGVRYATYAFHQGGPGARIMKPDATPWRLNPIFIDMFAVSPDPKRPAANLDFSKSFLRITDSGR